MNTKILLLINLVTLATASTVTVLKLQAKQGSAYAEPALKTESRSIAAYSKKMDIYGRAPIFSPGREPFVAEPKDGQEKAANQAVPALYGIIQDGGVYSALIQDATAGRSRVVKSGDSVSGWEVVSVESDNVQLKRDERAIKLDMKHTGGQKSGPSTSGSKVN